MSVDEKAVPRGQTLDGERFRIGHLLGGSAVRGRWTGEQLRPTRREVIVSLRNLVYSDEFDAWLRYDAPGIAPLLFIGSPDGYSPPQRKGMPWRLIAVVEARPAGVDLVAAERLGRDEVIRLGLGLCDTILAGSARGRSHHGLRPQTVYVVGQAGERRLAGATPRSSVFLGMGDHQPTFTWDTYRAPEDFAGDLAPESDLYSAAMVLWFALLGENPFGKRGYPEQTDNMWKDIRRPFTGPPELGSILERVLVCDVEKRMKVDEMRDELLRLAQAWNVEVPPFPPPGLEVM